MTEKLLESKLGVIGGERILLPVDIESKDLNEWLSDNLSMIKSSFYNRGALVIRRLPIQGSKKLERILSTIFDDDLLEYNYRSTPRTKMRGRIYTSSEYHPEETIGLHNENAYSNEWAMHISFYCVKPAEVGGATPISDSRKVYQSIPKEIREEFERKGLLYVRNYGDIDLPWQEVFQTNEREQVELFCRDNSISYEWIGDNGLRTSQRAGAAYIHPRTQEKVWFNQAHLFHVSSLGEANEQSLLDTFQKENLPRNVYFGNGDDIDSDTLQIIRGVYQEQMITFDWQEGDLMLLDNMLFAHGRQPFSGSRRVLVGMAGAMRAESLKT